MRVKFRNSQNREILSFKHQCHLSWQVYLSFIHVLDINKKNKVTASNSEIMTPPGCEKGCLDAKIIELHETMRIERTSIGILK